MLTAHEDFIGLYEVDSIEASTLVRILKDSLICLNVSLSKLRGQWGIMVHQIRSCKGGTISTPLFEPLCFAKFKISRQIYFHYLYMAQINKWLYVYFTPNLYCAILPSGIRPDVETVIQAEQPNDFFTHCYGHSLN